MKKLYYLIMSLFCRHEWHHGWACGGKYGNGYGYITCAKCGKERNAYDEQ
jgi:hypothetical protein